MISDRKFEHLIICTHSDVEYHRPTGFADVELVHRALPEVDRDGIDTSTHFLGKNMDAPLIITAITGGHPSSVKVNKHLAQAAEEFNIGMGLGSQRAAIQNPELKPTYTVARDEAPDILLLGNIGAAQIDQAQEAADMMELDALAIHLNPLQEVIQPDGDIDTRGYLSNIEKASQELGIPILVKETGAGISGAEARQLEKAGAAVIDVAGAGGTSWAAVETQRSKNKNIGNLYWDWGIPTAVSTVEVTQSVEIPVMASGGIRNGLDAAKALALGCETVGIALPALKAVESGHEKLISYLKQFIEELRVAMFLVGARNLEELRQRDLVITGPTREWLQERGYNTTKYARRSQL